LIRILTYVRRKKKMVVNGIATPIAMSIGPFNVSGCAKSEVFPGGGVNAGVREVLVVVVCGTIFP
jgi:hypothetical protein